MEAEMNILLEDSEWMNTLLQGQKAARDDLMPITQEQLKVSNHQLPSSIAILLNNVLPTSPSLLFANLAAARPVSAFGSGLNLFCICRKTGNATCPGCRTSSWTLKLTLRPSSSSSSSRSSSRSSLQYVPATCSSPSCRTAPRCPNMCHWTAMP